MYSGGFSYFGGVGVGLRGIDMGSESCVLVSSESIPHNNTKKQQIPNRIASVAKSERFDVGSSKQYSPPHIVKGVPLNTHTQLSNILVWRQSYKGNISSLTNVYPAAEIGIFLSIAIA